MTVLTVLKLRILKLGKEVTVKDCKIHKDCCGLGLGSRYEKYNRRFLTRSITFSDYFTHCALLDNRITTRSITRKITIQSITRMITTRSITRMITIRSITRMITIRSITRRPEVLGELRNILIDNVL